MSGFTRLNLPADITAFAGDFESQQLVFAHLLDIAPDLELEHVDVIQSDNPLVRLGVYFDVKTAANIVAAALPYGTLVLVLPASYEGLICPVVGSEHLIPLGVHRGTVPKMVASGASE